MARKAILENGYTFTPSTNTIVIPRAIQREKLILITNVTTNTVIYNFSDPNLRASSYTVNASNYQQGVTVDFNTKVVTGAKDTTTVVLNYNTASMSSTDKLQFVVDENEQFVPAETFQDPVSKLRVSTPQALIDTDFEYSVQPSKWESLALTQNYPTFYAKGSAGVAFDVLGLTGGNQPSRSLITVTTSVAHGLILGDIVSVQDSTNQLADGTFLIETVPTSTTFTYRAKGVVNGSILDTGYTTVTAGGIFNGARIGLAVSASAVTYSGTTVTVNTANAHGLYPGTPINLSNITTTGAAVTITNYIGNGTTTVTGTIASTTGWLPGDTIIISGATGTEQAKLNGTWTVASVPTGTTFTFVVSTAVVAGTYTTTLGTTRRSNSPNGAWIITNVSTPTQFQFVSTLNSTGTLSSGTNFANALLYTRPESYQQHRATDGGVLITTGSNVTGVQQIRQTRRYFRYQSGKGMQFSTGTKFTPTFDISTVSASGSIVTIVTAQDHNLQVGTTILVEGVESSSGFADSALYNGSRTVASVTGTKSFTYTTTATPTDLAPGGTNVLVTAIAWRAASVRSGMFDEQNGFYFEYDGQTLFACRRDSVKELFGVITVINASGTVTGTNTRFREQLVVGDKIVIKGQSYEISQIVSDTSLRINPQYVGPSRTNVKYLKTQNYRVPQSQWNMDKMDGTGPSGYNLDISKMQMAYIDYTWYGAGYIRFGFRGVNGDITYCHKMPNNNVNTSAYMRSGNLPGRFEAINQGPYTRLVAGATATRGSALASTDTTLHIENAAYWPTTGFVMLQDGTNSELIQYTGIGAYNTTVRGYPLTGLTRRATYSIAGINPAGSFAASAYTFSGTASSVTFTPDAGVGGAGTSQVGVQYLQNTCAPVVSHWGVSVIMDGGYNDDRSIIFTAGMQRYLNVLAAEQRPLLAIRIAPSVDSGTGRNFGIREIVNRMQLTLRALGIYSQGQFLVEGILNPQTIGGGSLILPTSWQNISVGSGSLAQVVYFDSTGLTGAAVTATGSFTGGDRIFAAYTEFSGSTSFNATRIELTDVRDLGTSILSGDGLAGNINPGYPVGPDILLISARNLGSTTSSIACRISWTEAQA